MSFHNIVFSNRTIKPLNVLPKKMLGARISQNNNIFIIFY